MIEDIILWIKDYFKDVKGPAIVGVSGGTDSSVCAALLTKALGKDRVIGVLMPKGVQHDISYSRELVEFLGIKHYEINIKDTVEALDKQIKKQLGVDPILNDVYKSNTPARIRMTTLYGICALYSGRVCNTCNLSEDYVGYSTKFGDAAGDFSLLAEFTKLGLPSKFVEKVPEDGMSGLSDEEKLGFTYETLDKYIRTGEISDLKIKERIEHLHKANLHKLLPMPKYIKK